MGQIVLHILCEGQTEERFVKTVLSPYLRSINIVTKTIVLTTNRRRECVGGAISFEQLKNELRLVIAQNGKDGYHTHYYSMMVDYYKLPTDYPDVGKCAQIHDPYLAIQCLEKSIREAVDCGSFIPYIQLHEFEALVLCGLPLLINEYPKARRGIEQLQQQLEQLNNEPEKVNQGEDTAPSQRLIKAFEGKYRYNKPQVGVQITSSVGIDELKIRCPHFGQWIETLEQLQ